MSSNYCSWNCQVECAKKMGAKTIAPNGLPIACIKADGTLMEHEHADHPHYMFPVVVEYQDTVMTVDDEWDDTYHNKTHALIYCDGAVALTLYEHQYSLWLLSTGAALSCRDKGWALNKESLEKMTT